MDGCLSDIICRWILLFLIAILMNALYSCSPTERNEPNLYSSKHYNREYYDDDYAEWMAEQEEHEGLSAYDRWR